jgi:hypothetical protein
MKNECDERIYKYLVYILHILYIYEKDYYANI